MDDFDWNAVCRRPLTREDVWELLRNGCNANEIAAAGGVTLATAIGMIRDAIPPEPRHEVLHLRAA